MDLKSFCMLIFIASLFKGEYAQRSDMRDTLMEKPGVKCSPRLKPIKC
jgi:hypothetical protein